jgi:hypothetical protein
MLAAFRLILIEYQSYRRQIRGANRRIVRVGYVIRCFVSSQVGCGLIFEVYLDGSPAEAPQLAKSARGQHDTAGIRAPFVSLLSSPRAFGLRFENQDTSDVRHQYRKEPKQRLNLKRDAVSLFPVPLDAEV